MKALFLLLASLFCVIVNGQNSAEDPTWKGRWTERQTERGAIEWLFQGKNNFAKINYWAGFQLDSRIHKGTFRIDSANNLVVLKFNRVFDIKNDTVLSTGYHEEWKIISMINNELLLSRKILFSTDKPNKIGDKENVYVRLVRTTKEAFHEPTPSNY